MLVRGNSVVPMASARLPDVSDAPGHDITDTSSLQNRRASAPAGNGLRVGSSAQPLFGMLHTMAAKRKLQRGIEEGRGSP